MEGFLLNFFVLREQRRSISVDLPEQTSPERERERERETERQRERETERETERERETETERDRERERQRERERERDRERKTETERKGETIKGIPSNYQETSHFTTGRQHGHENNKM